MSRLKMFLIFVLMISFIYTLALATSSTASNNPASAATVKQVAGWNSLPGILARIQAPTFPKRDFYVTQFGAVGNGSSDCSAAFSEAIKACSEAGGGKVVVPAGKYLTGPIHLLSNVDLDIMKGATILFSTDTKAYLPDVVVRWQGVEALNYSPLIYAYDQSNVAVTGEGTLDGRASDRYWWPWKGKTEYGWKKGQPDQNVGWVKLEAMAFRGLPVKKRTVGTGGYLRPNFIEFYGCDNVLIQGVSIVRSPMWEINPVLCENVTVDGVKINSHGPNNDGIDVSSDKYVLIENTSFNTGDDCIAIKSGRNADGRRVGVPSEDIVIRGVSMQDGHGAVTLGSEISAGVDNVFVEDSTMNSPNLWDVLRVKSNSMRGGTMRNIYMRNLKIGQVDNAVVSVNFGYGVGDVGRYTPEVRNIYLSNITSQKSKYAIYIDGYARSPIENLVVEDSNFKNVSGGNVLNYIKDLYMKDVTINGDSFNMM